MTTKITGAYGSRQTDLGAEPPFQVGRRDARSNIPPPGTHSKTLRWPQDRFSLDFLSGVVQKHVMRFLFRPWKQLLRIKPSCARRFSTCQAPLLSGDTLIEEETLPFYEPQQYYPVNIGDVYRSKYQVVGKLGYGAYSTVWLCRDLRYLLPSWTLDTADHALTVSIGS